MTTPPQPGIPKGPAAAEPGGLPAGTPIQPTLTEWRKPELLQAATVLPEPCSAPWPVAAIHQPRQLS